MMMRGALLIPTRRARVGDNGLVSLFLMGDYISTRQDKTKLFPQTKTLVQGDNSMVKCVNDVKYFFFQNNTYNFKV